VSSWGYEIGRTYNRTAVTLMQSGAIGAAVRWSANTFSGEPTVFASVAAQMRLLLGSTEPLIWRHIIFAGSPTADLTTLAL